MSMLSAQYEAFEADTKRRRVYHALGKRAFDLCVVIFALPFVLPLIALSALLVTTDGSRPFYRQQRIGRSGKVFQMVKLRTMVPDADACLSTYLDSNPAARAEWDEKQKLENDPRVTRFGGVLRKTSMDELPQLWNVLRGDMSIVGPRPIMLNQRDLYPGKAYYTVRPGLTGLWQVSRRNSTNFAARTHFDAHYCRNMSLKKDILIMIKTVSVVVRGTGC